MSNEIKTALKETAQIRFEIWRNDRIRLAMRIADLDNKINGFIAEQRRLEAMKQIKN